MTGHAESYWATGPRLRLVDRTCTGPRLRLVDWTETVGAEKRAASSPGTCRGYCKVHRAADGVAAV